MIPKAEAEKAKINKWDCIKQKTQTVEKITIGKSNIKDGRKIFPSHISDKDLISKVFLKIHITQ